MDQPGKEKKSMGINESVFEKRQTRTKDPNQNQPRQPKPDQRDAHQRYLEELAGKRTAGMGETLGMMGPGAMQGTESSEQSSSFDLPPEKQKYSQEAAGQGDQIPTDVSEPPEITSKGNEPEQKAHKQKYSVERHLPTSVDEYKATYTSQEPGQGAQQPQDIGQPPQISDKGAQDQQQQYKETYSINPSDQQPKQTPEGGRPKFETEELRREDEQLAQQTQTDLSLQFKDTGINASDDLGLSPEATEVLSKTSNFELSDSEIPHTRRMEQTDPPYSTQDLPDLGPDDSECDLGTRSAGAKNAFVHFMPTEPETTEEAVEPHVDRGDLQSDENVSHPEDFLTPSEKHEDQSIQQTPMTENIQQTQVPQGGLQKGRISKDFHTPSVEQELCIPDDVVNVLAEPSHFENRECHTRRLEETDPSYQTSDIPDLGPDDTVGDLGSRPMGAKNAFIHFMPEAPEVASEAVEPPAPRGDLQPDENVNQPEDFLTPQDKGQGIQQQGMSAQQQQGPGFIAAGQEVNITGGQGTQQPIRGSQRMQMGRCRVSFDPQVKAIEYHHNDSDLPESERANLPSTPVSGFPMTEMDLKAGKIKHAICKIPQRPILFDSEEHVVLGVKTGVPKLEVLDLAMEMTDLIPFSDSIRSGVHRVEDTYDYVKDTSPAPVRWGISLAERVVKSWIQSTSYFVRPFRFPIRLLDRISIGIIDACLPAAA